MLPLVSTMPTSFAISVGGVVCGDKSCTFSEYCSTHSSDCEPCADICTPDHNYDKHLCSIQCADYIKNREIFENIMNLTSEMKTFKIYLTIIFILTLLLLIAFFAVNGHKLFRLLRRLFTRLTTPNKSLKKVESVTMANPNTESPKLSNKNLRSTQFQLNRASSVFTISGSEYDQKTVSTPISRHPAEDTLTTMDNSSASYNFSYENKALQLTPVNEEKSKTETNF